MFAAYFTLISGEIYARNRTRLRILRRIHRLIYQNNCQVQLMWIPSKLNLADPFSRSQNYLPVPTSFNPDEVLNHVSTIVYCFFQKNLNSYFHKTEVFHRKINFFHNSNTCSFTYFTGIVSSGRSLPHFPIDKIQH